MDTDLMPRPTKWKPIRVRWDSFVPGVPGSDTLPALFSTPAQGWVYGAGSAIIRTSRPAIVRVRAQALVGRVGICLVSDNYSKNASNEPSIIPEQGETFVDLTFLPKDSPARIVVRNHNDDGRAGRVLIGAIIMY